jgi:uncharacterized protein
MLISDEALSRDERAAFITFLDAEPGRMPYQTCVGFLAAVASLPEMLPPSSWLPEVLGDSPVENEAQAQRVFGALMRLYNDCVSAVEHDPALICPSHTDEEAIAAFCRGYVYGVELGHPETAGEPARIREILAMLLALSDESAAHDVVELDKGETLETALVLFRKALPATLHYLFRAWRGDESFAEPFVRPESKPERNAPCPCGSGKKYKRCCLQ